MQTKIESQQKDEIKMKNSLKNSVALGGCCCFIGTTV